MTSLSISNTPSRPPPLFFSTNSLHTQGAVYAPVNSAYAPVRVDLTPPKPGDDIGDASGYNDNQGSKKRRAASRKMMGSDAEKEEVVEEMKPPHVDPFGGKLGGKLIISDDPLVSKEGRKKGQKKVNSLITPFSFSLTHLFSSLYPTTNPNPNQDLSDEFPQDYRNWASVLSQVLLKKEGNLEQAAKVLQRVMLAAHGHLSKVADGEEFLPRFHLQDPILTADAGNAINSATGGILPALPKVEGTMFTAGSTFFNYAPCVLSESYTGAQGSLTGLNFAPTLLQVRRRIRGGGGRGKERAKEKVEEKKKLTGGEKTFKKNYSSFPARRRRLHRRHHPHHDHAQPDLRAADRRAGQPAGRQHPGMEKKKRFFEVRERREKRQQTARGDNKLSKNSFPLFFSSHHLLHPKKINTQNSPVSSTWARSPPTSSPRGSTSSPSSSRSRPRGRSCSRRPRWSRRRTSPSPPSTRSTVPRG
jgi:hypothetical protein